MKPDPLTTKSGPTYFKILKMMKNPLATLLAVVLATG